MGLGISLLVFGILTYFFSPNHPQCDDCPPLYGYPFAFVMRSWMGYGILWYRLRSEVACVLGLALVVGLLLQMHSSRSTRN